MKFFIETLGCPKNFYDSEVAIAALLKNGHVMIDAPEDADVIIVNTCGFINDAKKESIDKIFDMDQVKKEGAKLIVSGCLSERYAEDIKDEMTEVDVFIGVNEYDRLPEIFADIEKENNERIYVSHHVEDILERCERHLKDNPYSATIKIAEGCNNICAYCIIPKIRGKFRSKKEEDVIAEAEELAKKGCKELILIAQDVTFYGYDIYGELRLAKLLKELCKIDGIKWIRLMYCYEDRITDELIDVMANEEKICKYIDIPIQHSSDNVLRSMNRRSTGKSLRNTVARLKKAMPNIHIRTTLIVGFPGETEEDYDDLVDFVEEERFARLGVFTYSQEENTAAGEMENQIDEEIKEQRLDGIMRRQLDISLSINKEKIGQVMEVIVDDVDEDGSYIGRTAYDAPEIDNSVLFTSNNQLKPGDMVKVLIGDAYDYDLVGQEA